MVSMYDKDDLDTLKSRIDKLRPDTEGQWGKMDVAQMLAHLNVAYEMTYESKHPQPSAFARMLLKWFVKPAVVGPKPYKKNIRTAPQFIINTPRDFTLEKGRLMAYMDRTFELGQNHFEQKENLSFGPMSSQEWNVLFMKHADHHLRQFGV